MYSVCIQIIIMDSLPMLQDILITLFYFYTIIHFFSPFSGLYECKTTVNSMPYVIWQTITIPPYPVIQVSTNKVVKCEDETISLQCCVQEIYQVEWNTDLSACSSVSTGKTRSFFLSFCICEVLNPKTML